MGKKVDSCFNVYCKNNVYLLVLRQSKKAHFFNANGLLLLLKG